MYVCKLHYVRCLLENEVNIHSKQHTSKKCSHQTSDESIYFLLLLLIFLVSCPVDTCWMNVTILQTLDGVMQKNIACSTEARLEMTV